MHWVTCWLLTALWYSGIHWVSKKGITNHNYGQHQPGPLESPFSGLQFVPRLLPPSIFDREGLRMRLQWQFLYLPGVAVVWGSSFNLFPVDGRGSSGGVRILLGGRWRGVCRVTVNCMSPPATPACSTAALPPGHCGIDIYISKRNSNLPWLPHSFKP